MAKANGLSGLYIVTDGIIGCGKSAQNKELKAHLPLDFPQAEFLFTYEPGGNPEADLLRQKLKNEKMTPVNEMRLFAESRSITLPQVVVPALAMGGYSLIRQKCNYKFSLSSIWQRIRNI